MPVKSALKTFCDEQEKWHARKTKHLFKTKEEFAKERWGSRVVYNPRSAYLAAHSLNAISAQCPRGEVKSEGDVDLRQADASRLTSEGCNLYT